MVRSSTVAFLLLMASSAGCGDKQNPAGDYQRDAGPTTVSYAKTIAPLMAASCTPSGCHGGSNPVMGIGLETYEDVKTNATVSNLVIQAQSMPINPGVPFTDTDRQSFDEWVKAGAPNN